MQGLLNVRDYCNSSGVVRLSVEGRDYTGQNTQIGYYVKGAKPTSIISNASFTLYINSSIRTATWVAQADHGSGWSPLVEDKNAPALAGHTAYTTYYLKNDWTYDPVTGTHSIPEYPHFVFQYRASYCPSPATVYSLRKVTVDGEIFQLRRGPGTLFRR